MKRFALIGSPVVHSLSPALHNAVFAAMGLSDEMRYELAETAEEDLPQRMEALRRGDYQGFSVTIPHKQAVMSYLDRFHPAAQRVGAVNTILRDEEGLLWGDNTDYRGFQRALIEAGLIHEIDENGDWGPNRERVLVLGAGGVGKAVIMALVDVGFSVFAASRTPERFEGTLSERFAVPVLRYDELHPEEDWQMIVNCTPVGMEGYQGPELVLTDPAWYRPDRVYAEVIYTPMMTPFLQKAREQDAKMLTGDRMFFWQAVEQARQFTGRDDVPLDVMEQTLKEHLS